jgi:hypothetical protein
MEVFFFPSHGNYGAVAMDGAPILLTSAGERRYFRFGGNTLSIRMSSVGALWGWETRTEAVHPMPRLNRLRPRANSTTPATRPVRANTMPGGSGTALACVLVMVPLKLGVGGYPPRTQIRLDERIGDLSLVENEHARNESGQRAH